MFRDLLESAVEQVPQDLSRARQLSVLRSRVPDRERARRRIAHGHRDERLVSDAHERPPAKA
jgi:hypothetical protein